MSSFLLKYRFIIPLALVLCPAPYFHEPHLLEKIRMLHSGALHKPVDIFDLILHAMPLLMLGYKVGSDLGRAVISRTVKAG